MVETDWRNWRKRQYRPAAEAAGVEDTAPYALRHLFVSLLIGEGRPLTVVARQAGHSVQTCSSTYAHVLEEFDGRRRDASKTVRAARRKLQSKQRPKKNGRQLDTDGQKREAA